jgi:acyl-CoA dehydrogenase
MNAPLLHESVAPNSAAAPDAPASPPLVAVEPEPGWRAAARRAAQIAAQYADSVDREARFPTEAFDALRRERLLSAMVPASYGGAGLSLADIAAICEILAQGCASTAMVYAMHQIQVACIEEHGSGSPWQCNLLTRLAEHQWLLASATSEETIGGNMRTSACSVELDGERFRIEKLAPTISYGAHADGILVTCVRTRCWKNAADGIQWACAAPAAKASG